MPDIKIMPGESCALYPWPIFSSLMIFTITTGHYAGWDSVLGRFLTSSKPNIVTDCWLEGHRTQQLTTTALDHPTWLRNIKGFHKFLWILMCLIALKYFNFLADLASQIVAAYCESLHFITSPPLPWWAHSSAQPTPTWNSSSKLSGGLL